MKKKLNNLILSPSYLIAKDIREIKNRDPKVEFIKLCSNESALGANPIVVKLLKKKLEEIYLYPDIEAFELKKTISKKLKIEMDQITLGNGSSDILEIIARRFITSNTSAIVSEFGYPLYQMLIKKMQGKVIKVPMHNWNYNLGAILEKIEEETRVIFLTNPNNPTGTWISHQNLDNFLEKIPKNIVTVIDEAYYEYFASMENYSSAIVLLSKYKNLIITRTFSKIYGLAGLRVGYSISNLELSKSLNEIKQPAYINSLALHAATLALNDEPYLSKVLTLVNTERQYVISKLTALGVNYISSQTNYILIEFKQTAISIYKELLNYNILVQPMDIYGLPNSIRVTLGAHSNNAQFISALSTILLAE